MDSGYPGGPKVDKLAKEGTSCIDLPKPNVDGLDFSYSGLKTAIINLHHKNPDINKADLCSSFQKVATEELIDKTVKALEQTGLNKVVLAGGVSANSYIREEFRKLRRK